MNWCLVRLWKQNIKMSFYINLDEWVNVLLHLLRNLHDGGLQLFALFAEANTVRAEVIALVYRDPTDQQCCHCVDEGDVRA